MDSEPIICYDDLKDLDGYLLIESCKCTVAVINQNLPREKQRLFVEGIIRRFQLDEI